jgi:hypothetical protein
MSLIIERECLWTFWWRLQYFHFLTSYFLNYLLLCFSFLHFGIPQGFNHCCLIPAFSMSFKFQILKKFFKLMHFNNTGWHKKRELLKNPTKIVEIQQKNFIDRNWTITTCRSTDPWLLNGEVVCRSRSLFRSAANCTWLSLSISKVPVSLCHPV